MGWGGQVLYRKVEPEGHMYLVVSDQWGFGQGRSEDPSTGRGTGQLSTGGRALSLPPHSYFRQNWAPPAPPSALVPHSASHQSLSSLC